MNRSGLGRWSWACLALGLAVAPVGWAQSYQYEVGFATLFGGSADEEAREVIRTADGVLLIGGQTHSADLPVSDDAIQTDYAGEPPGTGHPGQFGGDLFLLRLAGDGSAVEASTFFGGSKQERNAYGFDLDGQGNLVFSSTTRSLDLPTTPGAYQTTYGGGPSDSFVAKVTPDLKQLLWSTYVGQSGEDWARGGFALDADDNVVVIGRVDGPLASTPGAYSAPGGGWDALVLKLKADGSERLWSSRFGGSGNEALAGGRVGPDGTVYVAGHTWSSDLPTSPDAAHPDPLGGVDVFVAALSGDGTQRRYITRFGGSGDEFAEHRLGVLPDGSVLLSGFSNSPDLPTDGDALQSNRRGNGDGFFMKLSPDGRQVEWATYLGGGSSENLLYPLPDGSGNFYFVGETSSDDFPVAHNAIQGEYGGGGSDGVFGIISGDGGELLYATFLGGSGDDLVRGIDVGPHGEIYLVGRTSSPDFLTTPDAAYRNLSGGNDAFVVQLVPEPGSFVLLAAGTPLLRRRRQCA